MRQTVELQQSGGRTGIDVRPGSVKQARVEAGMSLADVARDDLTRSAIHRIESGRVRPSTRTLNLIAERTGRPVSFFLPPDAGRDGAAAGRRELELVRLRRLCLTEDFEAAVTAAEDLLDAQLQ